MKKTVGKILTLLFLYIVLVSNTNFAQGFTLGIKGGLNFATESYDPEDALGGTETTYRTGFNFGAFAQFDLEPIIIQPEVLYSMKGSIRESSWDEFKDKFTEKKDYLEIPILLKWKIPVTESVSPCIFVGPFLGFNLSARLKSEATGYPTKEIYNEDVESTDFGLVFGAGVDVVISQSTLLFDFRYVLGLQNINSYESSEGIPPAIKTRTISIDIGYGFSVL